MIAAVGKCLEDRELTVSKGSRRVGFPRVGYLFVLFHRGAIAPRTPHPAYLARGRVIPEWLVLNRMLGPSVFLDWLVSPGGYRPPDPPPCLSSKGAGHTRMLGPSVFPDSRVIPECLVLQYFQIHGSYQNAWSSDAQSISSDTQNKRYKFRHPKYKFKIQRF